MEGRETPSGEEAPMPHLVVEALAAIEAAKAEAERRERERERTEEKER